MNQINRLSWEILLGIRKVPDFTSNAKPSYRNRSQFLHKGNDDDETQPSLSDQESAQLANKDRRELRVNIRKHLTEDIKAKSPQVYKKMMIRKQIPLRKDGAYLTLKSFVKYFSRVKLDIKTGVSDETISHMYLTENKSLKHISKETGICVVNIKDRLACHGIINKEIDYRKTSRIRAQEFYDGIS